MLTLKRKQNPKSPKKSLLLLLLLLLPGRRINNQCK
jgi:hypothetical protein